MKATRNAAWILAALLIGSPAGLLSPGYASAQEAAPAPAEAAPGSGSGGAPGDEDDAVSGSSDNSIAGLDDQLKARAEALYTFLEGKRVNLYTLYQNNDFRDFFTTEKALQNYIAQLATRLAQRGFRKFRIERTEIQGFLPKGEREVMIEVKLIGRYHQPFLFWDKSETVQNFWKNEDGEWFVYPPPY